MPPPHRLMDSFFLYCAPTLGKDYGVGHLGLIQAFLACVMLSNGASGLAVGAAWLLCIVGLINLLLASHQSIDLRESSMLIRCQSSVQGLFLSSKIKSLRSIFATPNSSTRPGLFQTSRLGASDSHDTDKANATKNGKKGIIIGAPRPIDFNAATSYANRG